MIYDWTIEPAAVEDHHQHGVQDHRQNCHRFHHHQRVTSIKIQINGSGRRVLTLTCKEKNSSLDTKPELDGRSMFRLYRLVMSAFSDDFGQNLRNRSGFSFVSKPREHPRTHSSPETLSVSEGADGGCTNCASSARSSQENRMKSVVMKMHVDNSLASSSTLPR